MPHSYLNMYGNYPQQFMITPDHKYLSFFYKNPFCYYELCLRNILTPVKWLSDKFPRWWGGGHALVMWVCGGGNGTVK